MEAIFKAELNNDEKRKITAFCGSVEYFAIEQALGFTEILYKARTRYFYLKENDEIKSFCQVNENFKFAHIWYGPVCSDKEILIKSLREIISFYKSQGFWYLGVQMYVKSGYDADFIEYTLSRSNKIKYIFNNENTKSSIEIDLNESSEDIYSKIRKGHKSDIRKAINSGISVEEPKDHNDLKSFTEIYLKMCKARAIRGHTSREIEGICNYIIQNRIGKLLLAKDKSKEIIGGAILVYQGISVRYLISASDPDRRDLPMTHLIIYTALERAKSEGFKYFDFWGYNHFAEKDEQAFNINHFKKGFGGYYTFFAKKMNISLIPFGFDLYRLSLLARKLRGFWKIRKYLAF